MPFDSETASLGTVGSGGGEPTNNGRPLNDFLNGERARNESPFRKHQPTSVGGLERAPRLRQRRLQVARALRPIKWKPHQISPNLTMCGKMCGKNETWPTAYYKESAGRVRL
jgi:hypothetical protein